MSMPPSDHPAFGNHRPLRPLNSLRSHWLMALILFVPFIAAGLLAGYLTPPVYRSEAFISVARQEVAVLTADGFAGTAGDRGFINDQLHLLLNHYVLKDALLRMDEDADLWGAGPEERLRIPRLSENLEVGHVGGSNLIRVALSGNDPDGLAETVNAVVDAYIEYRRSGSFDTRAQLRDALNRRKRELESRLSGLLARKAQIIDEMGFFATESGEAGFETRLRDLQTTVEETNETLESARRELTALREEFATLDETSIKRLARARIERNTALQTARAELEQQRMGVRSSILAFNSREDYFVEDGETGKLREANSQERKIRRKAETQELEAALARLKLLEENYRQRRDAALAEARANIGQIMQAQIAEAEAAHAEAEADHAEAVETLESFREQLASLTGKQNQIIDLRVDIERTRGQLLAIDNRLDAFETEKYAPGTVNIQSRARIPEQPDHKRRLIVTAAVSSAGFFLALLLPMAVDFLNPWVLGPRDVQAILHVPPLGMVLRAEDEKTANFAEDQLRRIALALSEKRLKEGRRDFVMSGVKTGAGTTFLSFELARQIRARGLKVVVVEANAFNPDNQYAEEDRTGLADLLVGRSEVASVVEAGADADGIDRIAVGRLDGKRHLPEHGRLKEVLDHLHDRYDICLIDAPPILLSADAEALARVGDACLLIVEAEGITIKEMVRAAGTLERIESAPVAIIVNQVRIFKSSGYFADMVEEYDSARKAERTGLLDRALKTGD
jgi:polysaccharide biosynthesis transport protein